MFNSKMQIMTDTTMVSILQANALRVFHKKEGSLSSPASKEPSDAEKVLGAETPFHKSICHVNEDGFLTARSFSINQ